MGPGQDVRHFGVGKKETWAASDGRDLRDLKLRSFGRACWIAWGKGHRPQGVANKFLGLPAEKGRISSNSALSILLGGALEGVEANP